MVRQLDPSQVSNQCLEPCSLIWLRTLVGTSSSHFCAQPGALLAVDKQSVMCEVMQGLSKQQKASRKHQSAPKV